MRLVVMTTGREPSYVVQTLMSVFASDWQGDVTVCTDPTGITQLEHIRHHHRISIHEWDGYDWERVRNSRVHRKAGTNYVRCLELVAQDPEGGIILEDDVVVRDDIIEETETAVWNAGRRSRRDFVVLLYSARDPSRVDINGGFMNPNLFFGTQGIYWPQKTAAVVAPYLREHAMERNESVYDLLIRQFFIDNKLQMILPERGVVQHVGRETTGMGSFHQNPSWCPEAKPIDRTAFLTVGIGGEWPARARRLAERLRTFHPDRETVVVTQLPTWLPCRLPNPSWLKIFCWDLVPSWVERVVWLDADVVPMRCFPELDPEIDFAAVEDAQCSSDVARRLMPALSTGSDKMPDPYFNFGVWVASRKTETLFRALQEMLVGDVWKHHPQFYEQSFANLLIRRFPFVFKRLPRECNWMSAFGPPPDDVICVHHAGNQSRLDAAWDSGPGRAGEEKSNRRRGSPAKRSTMSAKYDRGYRGRSNPMKRWTKGIPRG